MVIKKVNVAQAESLHKILRNNPNGISNKIDIDEYINALKLLNLDTDSKLHTYIYNRIVDTLKEVHSIDQNGNKIYKYQRYFPLTINPDLENELVHVRCGIFNRLREWNINTKDKKMIIDLVRQLNEDSPLNMDKKDLCESIKHIIVLWTLDADQTLLRCSNKLRKLWTDPKLSKYIIEILSPKEFNDFVNHYITLHDLIHKWMDPTLYDEIMNIPTICPKNHCRNKIEALKVFSELVQDEAKKCEKLVCGYEAQSRRLYVRKDEHHGLIDRIIDIFYI